MLKVRSSFSQHELFENCSRLWFYNYVLGIRPDSDMSYANAGNAIHECLELHYKNDISINDVKTAFKIKWKQKGLENGILKDKQDAYWLMIVEGINKDLVITDTEMELSFPDCKGYLDVVNTNNDKIFDWKSSTRGPWNEKSYKKQMLLYSWLYFRKFNKLPSECIVYYLKYTGTKGEIRFTPEMEEVLEIETWYYDILKQMITLRETKILPEKVEECYMFCPDALKETCMNNMQGEIDIKIIILGNFIKVFGPITPMLHYGIQKKFSYVLKDSFFILKKMQEKENAIAKNAGRAPRHITFDGTIHYWNVNKQLLPIGFMKEFIVTLNDYAEHKKLNLKLDIDDRRKEYKPTLTMPDLFKNGVVLRDYQLDAVSAFLKEKLAILEIGTGGGKSEIAIEIIRRLRCRTIFIVDKISLLTQTKKRIENALGIEVGTIGAGENSVKEITVATIQTLNKNLPKYSAYLQTIPFAVFDECHHTSSASYTKIANYLGNTRYRLGLSATAWRDDGNDMAINSIVGYKCFDLSAKTLIEKGWLVDPTIKFLKVGLEKNEIKQLEQQTKEGLINETENYADYYKTFISENVKRNELIKKYVKKYKDKKIIILTKLVDHGKLLAEMTGGTHLYGETLKKNREEMMQKLKDGKINVLVSTISCISEGVDIPHLDIIINAAANRGDVKSIQVLGRVLRKKTGKISATYIDFVDQTRFFERASRARIKIFRKENYSVLII